MQRIKIYMALAALLVTSCFAQKKMEKTLESADQSYYQKEYEDAFDSYSQVIEYYTAKGQTAPGEVYNSAGKSLYYNGSKMQAMEYFSLADKAGYDDEQSLFLMIQYYGEHDNLSKEVDCLEKYAAVFPTGPNIKYVDERLFIRYVDMKEWSRANYAYENLPRECVDRIDILEKYHQVCEKLNNSAKADEVATKLYNLDPNNLIGLNYMAWTAYNSVEQEYVNAVRAYEAKKTQSSYQIMKKKVEPLRSRYKTAKAYYVRLYNLYKRPSDAAILSRICGRLMEKSNAKYYDRLSKKTN